MDIAVEVPGHDSGAGAVAVHDIKPRDLVTLVLIIESYISDLAPVGRKRRVLVRAIAISQGLDAAVADGDFVDLRIEGLILPVIMPVG